MRMTNTLRCLGVAAIFAVGVSSAATAQTAEAFYKGRTITAIVPSGPESEFAVFTQLMAPFIEKYTGASVQVRPMPGAGGYQARNEMFKAEPDGLTVVLVGHGAKLIAGGMFNLEGVRYDWKKFVPLGKVIDTDLLIFVAKDSPWQTPQDARDTPLNYGEGSVFFGPQVAEALGWSKARIIPGFRSTAERAAAIARGEIQATAASQEVIATYPDQLKLLAVSTKLAEFPDVPTIAESATEEGKPYADLIEGWVGLLDMSYAPPGLPEDRRAFLEEALRKTWEDPEFAKALDHVKASPTKDGFLTSKQLRNYMDELANLSEEQVKELEYIVTEKYKK